MTRAYHEMSNRMREQAQNAGNDKSRARHGVISSYDPATHAVKVRIQPEDTESGWMGVGAIGVGNGFGFAVGPNIGDQVLVEFAEGDFESGRITGRFFDATNQAIPVPSGEIWAVHQSGSLIKFLNTGDLQLVAARNFSLVATGTASYTAAAHQFVGPVVTDKTIMAGGDITDNVATGNAQTMYGMRRAYDIHYHTVPNVQGGSSTVQSNVPSQQI